MSSLVNSGVYTYLTHCNWSIYTPFTGVHYEVVRTHYNVVNNTDNVVNGTDNVIIII